MKRNATLLIQFGIQNFLKKLTFSLNFSFRSEWTVDDISLKYIFLPQAGDYCLMKQWFRSSTDPSQFATMEAISLKTCPGAPLSSTPTICSNVQIRLHIILVYLWRKFYGNFGTQQLNLYCKSISTIWYLWLVQLPLPLPSPVSRNCLQSYQRNNRWSKEWRTKN